MPGATQPERRHPRAEREGAHESRRGRTISGVARNERVISIRTALQRRQPTCSRSTIADSAVTKIGHAR
jgi:hypothetical protein